MKKVIDEIKAEIDLRIKEHNNLRLYYLEKKNVPLMEFHKSQRLALIDFRNTCLSNYPKKTNTNRL